MTGLAGEAGPAPAMGAGRDRLDGDEALLAAVKAGDRAALRALYERHAPWLAGRLARQTASRELAEEALQDTFLAVWRKAGTYRGGGDVGAWLWGIARRRMVSLGR